jgi:ferredoxin/flavodoxin---NADP+ reductase
MRIAIIGSGPSAFYAAEGLLSDPNSNLQIDMFDRLPTPFGLVRGGVAPDHQKIKSVVRIYEKTAARPTFRFFGNVEFGRDFLIEDARKLYDAIVLAVGAKSDRRMNIPGEDLIGSHPATNFVGWYNGHPDYRDEIFDLSSESIAVIGNGNVAMDVTRILMTDPKALEPTDIADYALAALRKSQAKTVFLLGRRGPAQAAFTNPEIRELCNLPGADLVVDPKEVELDDIGRESLSDSDGGATARNNFQILTEQSKKGPGTQSRKIVARFLVSPVEVIGNNGRVTAVKLEKNRLVKHTDGSVRAKGTGEFETIPVGMILRSIGYMGIAIPGIPFEERSGTIPNQSGRVIDPGTKMAVPGLYVVGWAKRGPSGVIGTNKPDSLETAKLLLEDLRLHPAAANQRDPDDIVRLLETRKIHYVTFDHWKILDRSELEKGKLGGKVRHKYTAIADMIAALKAH